MNIHYRILKVDLSTHAVLVRYWTDKVTEMDLAEPQNLPGGPPLNADGYPLNTRTDILLTIYDTPTPTPEELDKRIMMAAPVDWLKLQEDIKDQGIDTSMSTVRNMIGDTKEFTPDDIMLVRQELGAALAANTALPGALSEQQATNKAYEVIGALTDSIKVLQQKDPAAVSQFANTLNTIVNSTP